LLERASKALDISAEDEDIPFPPRIYRLNGTTYPLCFHPAVWWR